MSDWSSDVCSSDRPALVDELARRPERLVLGGETREMTLLFADVRGFTGIAELYRGNPQGLTRLVNRLRTPLSRDIVKYKGKIDKYMGYAVLEFKSDERGVGKEGVSTGRYRW